MFRLPSKIKRVIVSACVQLHKYLKMFIREWRHGLANCCP